MWFNNEKFDYIYTSGNELIDGISYSGKWANHNITFSFVTDIDQVAYHETGVQYRKPVEENMKNGFRVAMQKWNDVANINLNEVSTTGDINITRSSSDRQAWGWSRAVIDDSSTSLKMGDIEVSSKFVGKTGSWAEGTYNFSAAMHEIGHSLGLKHPFDAYNSSDPRLLSKGLDTCLHTIMSYTDASTEKVLVNGVWTPTINHFPFGEPSTPMILDMLAIQFKYGANMTYHAGNDVYSFVQSEKTVETIWDAGGVDTFDVSTFAKDCTIDLRPGNYSFLGANPSLDSLVYDHESAVGIAYNCTIENVVGGSGCDTFYGNAANNYIDGGTDNVFVEPGRVSSPAIRYDSDHNIDTLVMTCNFDSNIIKIKHIDTGGYIVSSPTDGEDILVNVEHIKFNSSIVELDMSSSTAQLYRMYDSVFGRTPDKAGLGYWVDQMEDHGATNMDLNSVANCFANSAEFQSIYGSTVINPTITAALVIKLYQNVLDRDPEPEGYQWWTDLINSKTITVAQAIVGFSESQEHQIKILGQIENGIEYIPYNA